MKTDEILPTQKINLTTDELELFAKRLAGYLRSRATTKNNILQGMFILDDIFLQRAKREREALSKRINFGNSKHVYLKKYAVKILELREEGFGSQRIAKHLKVNHNAKISRSLIDKFLKLNG